MRISYYLRSSDRDSRGYAPIYLRISHRGTQRYISLELKVLAGRGEPHENAGAAYHGRPGA